MNNKNKKVNDANCVLCEFVMKYIEDQISDNATESEIISVVQKICIFLPGSIRTQCEQFIQQEGQAIIELILQNESPDVICTQIGVCSSKVLRRIKDDNLCPICQLIVSIVDNFLSQNSTIGFIEDQLKQFPCELLPGQLEKQCDDFIDLYVPQLINWILKNEDSQTFCTQVGLCGGRHRMKMEGGYHHKKMDGKHHKKMDGGHKKKWDGEHKKKWDEEHQKKWDEEHQKKWNGEHKKKWEGEHKKMDGKHHKKIDGEHNKKMDEEHQKKWEGEHKKMDVGYHKKMDKVHEGRKQYHGDKN